MLSGITCWNSHLLYLCSFSYTSCWACGLCWQFCNQFIGTYPWCSYFTNTLILPALNGPTEGLMVIYMSHFFTAIVGMLPSHSKRFIIYMFMYLPNKVSVICSSFSFPHLILHLMSILLYLSFRCWVVGSTVRRITSPFELGSIRKWWVC